jgi:hypothetical protein
MNASLYHLARFVVLSFVVGGCSGGGSSSSGPPVGATPVQATVTPSGGTVQAESDDTTFKLTIPAGAVRENVTLTLTPVTPESGAWARLQVAPAGVQFFEPVTLTITTPQAQSGLLAGIYLGSAGNSLSLPTTVNAATGTVAATTLVLGPSRLGQAKPIALGVNGEEAAGESDFINVGALDCANELSVLAARIEYAENFVFSANPSAYELIQQYKAMQAACANPNPTEAQQMEQETTEIKDKACTAQTNTLDAVNLFPVQSEEDLYEQVARLLGSQASLVLTDAECGSPGSTETGVTKAVDDYIDAYDQRLSSPNFGGGTWLGLRGEVKSIIKLHDAAGMLLLEDQKQTVIDTLLKPAMDKLRARAYQLCREDNPAEGNQSYLADVKSGGQVFGVPIPFLAFDFFGKTLVPAGLANDIQYCASDLTIEAYDGVDLLEDQTLVLGGGDTPGTHVTQGTIEVPVAEGALSLEGIIRPLRCATPNSVTAYEDSTLVFKFNGVTVQTLPHSNGDFLPTNALDVNVSELYTAVGLNSSSPGAYVLEIMRQGTGCNGLYGDATFKLFEVTVVSGGAPAVQLEATFGEFNGTSAPLTVVVRDGNGAPLSGVFVEFAPQDPLGGTVSPGFATTNAFGSAETTATLAEGSTTMSVDVTARTGPGGEVLGQTTVHGILEQPPVEIVTTSRADVVRATSADGESQAFWYLEGADGPVCPPPPAIPPSPGCTAEGLVAEIDEFTGRVNSNIRWNDLGTGIRLEVIASGNRGYGQFTWVFDIFGPTEVEIHGDVAPGPDEEANLLWLSPFGGVEPPLVSVGSGGEFNDVITLGPGRYQIDVFGAFGDTTLTADFRAASTGP